MFRFRNVRYRKDPSLTILTLAPDPCSTSPGSPTSPASTSAPTSSPVSHLPPPPQFLPQCSHTSASPGPFPSSFASNTKLVSLYLSSNAFSGPFPAGEAPPKLSACYVMPNAITPCPTADQFADPQSFASKCHLSCPKSNGKLTPPATPTSPGVPPPRKPAGGIPVSPLPGEALMGASSVDPPQQPIPAVGQVGSVPGGAVAGGIPPQRPAQGTQQVAVGQAASLNKMSGARNSASISVLGLVSSLTIVVISGTLFL